MLIDTDFLQLESELTAIVTGAAAMVFDWNGTVVDDLERAIAATNAVLATSGREPLDRAAFVDAFCLPLDRFFAGLGIAGDALATTAARWNDELAARSTLLQPWIGELLDICRAQSLLTGVISAASETAIEADMRSCALTPEPCFVFGSVHDKAAALRAIADSIDGTVIYVGDTEYDMISAAAAGAAGLAYTRGYRPAAALIATPAAALLADYRVLIAALSRR